MLKRSQKVTGGMTIIVTYSTKECLREQSELLYYTGVEIRKMQDRYKLWIDKNDDHVDK
jgi:hypothetical protein